LSPSLRLRVAAPAALAAALALAPAAHAAVTPAFQLLSQSTWTAAQPLVGASIFTPPVVEGGWSAFAPIDDHTYWTVSDRGPNGQPNVTVGGTTSARRTFLAPAFTPTIYKVAIGADGLLSVLQRIPLHLKAGAVDPAQAWMAAHPNPAQAVVAGPVNQITGLPEIVTAAQGVAAGLPAGAGAYVQSAARDEVPYAADGVTAINGDPYGLDTETIAVDPRDGSFWLGDEYRPSLVHVAADGTLLNRIVPAGESIPADPADPLKFPGADDAVVATQPLLPAAFAYRKQNRGMEGGSLTPDGRTLFGAVQSSLEPPAGHGDSRTLRIVRFDVSDAAHPVLTGEFVYRLDTPNATSGVKQTDISVSDLYAIDATHLLIDEHDNVTDVAGQGQKGIYEADLAGATNIAGDAGANGLDPQLEATNAAGVTPVAKTQWLDLVKFGYNHDKPEGIGLFPNGDLAVQDDNDFGFAQGNDPESPGPTDPPFKVSASGHTTQLWRFHATNITTAPVSGTVPATLSLTLGAPASFGAFTPGVANDYAAATTATVISSAGDGALSVADPSATATGHLVNGAFALPSPLQAKATSAAGTGNAFADVGGTAGPTALLAYTGPVSNDAVALSFSQHVGASDALRTGAYGKTLTFTLSTTTP
jgi:hypothetical protein